MHAVLDTNVWVSALIQPRGPCGLVIGAVAQGTLAASSTHHLWAEVERALRYPQVQRVLEQRADPAARSALVTRLRAAVRLVPDVAPTCRWVPEDTDDNWVVQCAITAGADVVVTGDRRVLAVHRVGLISVVSPAKMAASLGLLPSAGPGR